MMRWGDWGNSYNWMWFLGPIFMVIFWVLFIVGIAYLVKWVLESTKSGKALEPDSAIDILKKRYARGEISKKEYEEIKKDI